MRQRVWSTKRYVWTIAGCGALYWLAWGVATILGVSFAFSSTRSAVTDVVDVVLVVLKFPFLWMLRGNASGVVLLPFAFVFNTAAWGWGMAEIYRRVTSTRLER